MEGCADGADLHAPCGDRSSGSRQRDPSSYNFTYMPVSTDPEAEDNLNVISGVDEGIRTPNNRNHNPRSLASAGAGFRAVVGIFPPR